MKQEKLRKYQMLNGEFIVAVGRKDGGDFKPERTNLQL